MYIYICIYIPIYTYKYIYNVYMYIYANTHIHICHVIQICALKSPNQHLMIQICTLKSTIRDLVIQICALRSTNCDRMIQIYALESTNRDLDFLFKELLLPSRVLHLSLALFRTYFPCSLSSPFVSWSLSVTHTYIQLVDFWGNESHVTKCGIRNC